MPLADLQLAVYRELGNRGWDKTASGWRNVRTGEVKTMDAALQMEIDAENAPADGRASSTVQPEVGQEVTTKIKTERKRHVPLRQRHNASK